MFIVAYPFMKSSASYLAESKQNNEVVQSRCRSLPDRDLLEIQKKQNKAKGNYALKNNSGRKEKLPKWMDERDQEEKENTSTNVMDESKLEEFKTHVLKIAENMNLTIDVTSINLENYKV